MDMKLISATVCTLVLHPYIISVDHSLQIHPFKTSYTYSSYKKVAISTKLEIYVSIARKIDTPLYINSDIL